VSKTLAAVHIIYVTERMFREAKLTMRMAILVIGAGASMVGG
jgi:hypothetical protein